MPVIDRLKKGTLLCKGEMPSVTMQYHSKIKSSYIVHKTMLGAKGTSLDQLTVLGPHNL